MQDRKYCIIVVEQVLTGLLAGMPSQCACSEDLKIVTQWKEV